MYFPESEAPLSLPRVKRSRPIIGMLDNPSAYSNDDNQHHLSFCHSSQVTLTDCGIGDMMELHQER
jgi:hypothetical protein